MMAPGIGNPIALPLVLGRLSSGVAFSSRAFHWVPPHCCVDRSGSSFHEWRDRVSTRPYGGLKKPTMVTSLTIRANDGLRRLRKAISLGNRSPRGSIFSRFLLDIGTFQREKRKQFRQVRSI